MSLPKVTHAVRGELGFTLQSNHKRLTLSPTLSFKARKENLCLPPKDAPSYVNSIIHLFSRDNVFEISQVKWRCFTFLVLYKVMVQSTNNDVTESMK